MLDPRGTRNDELSDIGEGSLVEVEKPTIGLNPVVFIDASYGSA